MEILDVLILSWLERVSDKIEERCGRAVAWWATLAMCLSVLGAIAGVFYMLVQ
jgi:hypothetical protein